MRELIRFFTDDIESGHFTKREKTTAALATMLLLLVAILAGAIE